MKSEINIMHSIMIALGKLPNVRVFRNNVGQAWVGTPIRIFCKQIMEVFPGDVVLRQARPFHAGLCKGSTDLIGIKSIIVTSDMVGKKLGIFISPEIKTDKGITPPEQQNFINMVNEFGGIGFVARSEEEALNYLNK